MIQNFFIRSDNGYPMPFSKPVPRAVAYHLKIEPTPRVRWHRFELWLDVGYKVINLSSGNVHDSGHFTNSYQLFFDFPLVTADDLYRIVQSISKYLWPQIYLYYERHSLGQFVIVDPPFEEIKTVLDSCAEWFNSQWLEAKEKRVARV